MSVEEFTIKIQKFLFWFLVLVKDIWTWTIVASKVVNFIYIIKLKTLVIKEFWWEFLEMMLIDYPHSKSTHNLKVMKF